MSSPYLPGGTNTPLNVDTPKGVRSIDSVPDSVETIIDDPLKHFVENLDIERLWKGEDYNTIIDTDEKIKRFKNEFKDIVLIMKNFKELISSREDIKNLFSHDIATMNTIGMYESLDIVIPLYNEMGRDYMKESIEDLIQLHVYSKKMFLSFLESLYFILDFDKKTIESKKRTIAIGELLSLSIGDERNIVTSINDTQVEVYNNIGDIIIFIRNIIRNTKKHNTFPIVRNGDKSSSTGKVEVFIQTEKVGNELKIIIQDDGSGIPETILPHIFEKGVSGGESSGLGLRDLEKRGIQARASNEGLPNESGSRGACFEITLPVKKES